MRWLPEVFTASMTARPRGERLLPWPKSLTKPQPGCGYRCLARASTKEGNYEGHDHYRADHHHSRYRLWDAGSWPRRLLAEEEFAGVRVQGHQRQDEGAGDEV